MSGPNGAEANSGLGQGLAESRGRLEAMAARLEKPGKNPEPDEQYWFYEHLRQLNLEVNNLLEEFERRLQPPISLDDVVEQLIQPLEVIYDDLYKYYWKPQCLLSKLVGSEVDKALLATTGEIREDWGLLASAIKVYVAARPKPSPEEPVRRLATSDQIPEQPMTLLATSDAFYRRLLAFVKLLSGLVTSKGFTREHSRLANSIAGGRRPRSGQVRKTISSSAPPSREIWSEDRSPPEEPEREMQSVGETSSAANASLALIPYDSNTGLSALTFHCTPGEKVQVEASGVFYQELRGEQNFSIELDAHARRADEAFGHDWRFKSADQGKDLFKALFNDPDVASVYYRALGVVHGEPENLHLRFPSSRTILRLPLEFLHDRKDYLVLQYPLSRSLVGRDVEVSSRGPLDPAFLNDLHSQGKPLAVLLIASDTPPDLPHVDEEIRQIAEKLRDITEKKGLELSLEVLSSHDATLDAVKKAISTGDYHIIHYAGHAVTPEGRPDDSYVRFWTGTAKTGEVKKVNMPMLQRWFGAAKSVRFVYLSCCLGAAQEPSASLLTNHSLGIADNLIQASVPAVLGHRWPAVDSNAMDLSISFYDHLLRYGRIDTALLHARRDMAMASDRDDRSWLSAVLILQG
jgi:CHAT domain-containing protein